MTEALTIEKDVKNETPLPKIYPSIAAALGEKGDKLFKNSKLVTSVELAAKFPEINQYRQNSIIKYWGEVSDYGEIASSETKLSNGITILEVISNPSPTNYHGPHQVEGYFGVLPNNKVVDIKSVFPKNTMFTIGKIDLGEDRGLAKYAFGWMRYNTIQDQNDKDFGNLLWLVPLHEAAHAYQHTGIQNTIFGMATISPLLARIVPRFLQGWAKESVVAGERAGNANFLRTIRELRKQGVDLAPGVGNTILTNFMANSLYGYDQQSKHIPGPKFLKWRV